MFIFRVKSRDDVSRDKVHMGSHMIVPTFVRAVSLDVYIYVLPSLRSVW